jgi:hypothetical protein
MNDPFFAVIDMDNCYIVRRKDMPYTIPTGSWGNEFIGVGAVGRRMQYELC